jgi:hypothetical protein
LRCHLALPYGYGPDVPRLPAMVAMVTNLGGAHIATHRTWLTADGRDKAGAAELGLDARGEANDAKKVRGRYLGGHISVWKGAQRCPLRDIAPGTDVYVSEGIEDGLTVAMADPSLRIIAMIAVSNLAALELPPQLGRLMILKQNDPPGSKAEKAVLRAVTHHRSQGRRVLFVPPPRGVKDLNMLIDQREAG